MRALFVTLFLAVFLAVCHGTPLRAEAAGVDAYLKIDGIRGESRDTSHKDEIEVVTWGFGENSAVTMAAGSAARDRAAGHAQIQDFRFTARMSAASPYLYSAGLSGKRIKEAVFTLRKAGQRSFEFLKIRLHDVMVSGYQTGTAGTDPYPLDTVSLSFGRIEIEYVPQKADGSPAGSIKQGWDVKANKGM